MKEETKKTAKKAPVGRSKKKEIKKKTESPAKRRKVGKKAAVPAPAQKKKTVGTAGSASKTKARTVKKDASVKTTAKVKGDKQKKGTSRDIAAGTTKKSTSRSRASSKPAAVKKIVKRVNRKTTATKKRPAPLEILPAGYDENSITLVPVDPQRLFVFWEVRKEDLREKMGDLTIRVHNVFGNDPARTDADTHQEFKVSERIGKMYVDVWPSRGFVADIGFVSDGSFVPVVRSFTVYTPPAGAKAPSNRQSVVRRTGRRIGY